MKNTILTPELDKELKEFENDGYFGRARIRLIEFIEEGIFRGRFTREEAEHDLEIALRIAFDNNNFDTYETYLDSVKWLSRTESVAGNCGTWFYRYAVALTYCGRLEEALRYAEEGTEKDPEYPWCWLHLAAMRSHFGDKEGALAAISKGLEIVPDDYEFLRRGKEISAGTPLDIMMNHYIEEEDDLHLQDLKEGDAEWDDKYEAISTIICNDEKLQEIESILQTNIQQEENGYCSCTIPYKGEKISLMFQTNKAGLSKFDTTWVRKWLNSMDQMDRMATCWIDEHSLSPGRPSLAEVLFYRQCDFTLFYRNDQDDDKTFVDFTRNLQIDENSQGNYNPAQYSNEAADKVFTHIDKYFGEPSHYISPDIAKNARIDILVFAPNKQRNYYMLVTFGAGAIRMPSPRKELRRAEFVICLPPDWNPDSGIREQEWPSRVLTSVAHTSSELKTWVGEGHTISWEEPFAKNTTMKDIIITPLQDMPAEASTCTLPDGDTVTFYEIIPLYPDELDFKNKFGYEALMGRMLQVDHVLDINRTNTCKGFGKEKGN